MSTSFKFLLLAAAIPLSVVMRAQATLQPLLPSAAPGIATGPGTVTINADPSQQVNGKGTVTVTLPASLPIIPCPTGPGQCLGPATVHITHTLTGFDSYLISTSQNGLTPQKIGGTNIYQCDDRDYANNFTPRTSFDCQFDWLPYDSGSLATYSTHVKFDISTTGNFTPIDYIVDFQWGPQTAGCPAPPAQTSGLAPRDVSCNDLAIDSIQVVQSMQAPYNPVKLIQGKDTWVRVFVKSVGPGAKTLTSIGGKLIANGATYDPVKSTVQAESSVFYSSFINFSSSTLKTYANNSLDFHIGVVAGNQLNLIAQVSILDSQGNPETEGNTANNQQAISVGLESPGSSDSLLVGLGYVCTNDSGKIACPPHFSELEIDPSFPVPHTKAVQVLLPKLTFDMALIALGNPDGRAFATITMIKEYLRAAKLSQSFGFFGYPEPDQVVFILGGYPISDADNDYGVPGGIGGRYWWVGVQCGVGDLLPCIDTMAIGHGIGHNYGLSHGYDSPYGTFSDETYRNDGYSNAVGEWGDTVFGLMAKNQYKLASGERLSLTGPEFNALHSAFTKTTSSAHARPAATTTEIAVISGTVSTDGLSGTLDPAFHGPGSLAADPTNPSGDTCLRFTPAGASSDYCFQALFANGATKGYFAVAAPYPTGTTRVDLMRNGSSLASLSTGAAPQIAFTSPVSGQSWQGAQTLRWSASGAANAIYRLEYSPDNGTSWLPLSGDLTTAQYDFDTSDILGGSIQFRVTASTGLTNVSAVSPTVQIVQNPQLSLPSASVSFNNVQIGASDTQSLAVMNAGTGQLLVKIVPPANSAFQLLTDQMFIVAAGTSMNVGIRFTPTSAGQQQTTMKIGNQDVTLRGAGFTTIVPNIQIASPLDFGEVQTGQQKDTVFTISNTGSDSLNISALSLSGNGLSIPSPRTPLTIIPGDSAGITAHITGGSVGTQSGQFSVTSNDPTRGQLQIPATVRVDTASVPVSSAAGVLNAAGYQGGAVAPGEMVVIFGSTIGPPTVAGLQLDSNGRVATLVSETRVLFDGYPAPIIYALAGQTSVIVPYEIAGQSATSMVVEYQGRRSDPVLLAVTNTVPALFSANSSGTGQGAILNQDYSSNSSKNPAQIGSAVILFGTGEGSTNPGVIDGSVTAGVVQPILPVTVTIGGVPQTVLYAGEAPSLVAGVLQVNVQIAPNTPGGNQPVVVTVGTVSSQTGLTVAIAAASGPTISVTVPATDFGPVNPGATNDLTITIGNTGTSTLSVTPSFTPNPPFSIVSPTGSLSINAGTSQTMRLRFSPTALGGQTGTLTLTTSDTAHPTLTYTFTGTGASPTVSATVPVTDFGTVNTGSTKDLTVTIASIGLTTLSVMPSMAPNPPFSIVGSPAALSINAGTSQTLTVRFSPATTGAQNGTLTLTTNDPAHPTLTFHFTGTGATSSGGSGSGNIVSIKIEGGSYGNGVFKPTQLPDQTKGCEQGACATFDTDPTTTNFALGVSTGLAPTPLLNPSGKALPSGGIAPGTYYTFNQPAYSWSGNARVTVTWSTGPPDVAYFAFAGFSNKGANSVWPNEGGVQTITVTGVNRTDQCRVEGTSTQPSGCPSNNEVLLITINSSSEGGSGGTGSTINSTLTITGSGSTTSGNVSASGTVSLSGVGSGTFSSNFSLASAAVSGAAPITISITSGSPTGTLTGSLSGSPTLLAQVFAGNPSASGPATVTITSGTGGFSGATGSFNVTASGTGTGVNGSGSGNFSITGSGTITIPGSGSGSGGPTISVTVPATDFGPVNPGATNDLTITIGNTGTSTLSVTPSFTPNPPFSIVSPTGSLSINAGTSQTMRLRFSPTTLGAQTGTLTLTTSDTAHPTLTYTFTGTGATPTVSATAAVTDFGTVNTGTTKDLTVTIASIGLTTLSVTPGISPNPPFSLVGSPAALSINAGTSQTLTVRFSPATTGAQNGTLTLTTNDPAHPTLTFHFTGTGATSSGGSGSGNIVSIKIEGGSYGNGVFTPTQLPDQTKGCEQGACATFDTDPTTTNFALGVSTGLAPTPLLNPSGKALPSGGIAPGTYYTFNQPAYSWSGNARVTVTWSTGPPDVAYFAFAGFSNKGANSVWPNEGGVQTITVTGVNRTDQCRVEGISTQPSGCPSNNEVLLITINSSSGGTAGGGSPTASVTVPVTDFGTVNTGSTKDLTVTIASTGTSTLSVTPGITPNPPFSIVGSPAALSINAGTSKTLTVRFSPATSGAQTGTLTLTTNDTAHPTLTYQFTGTGVTSTPTTVTLAVDGGTFTNAIGFPNAATAVFVNRLTPPSYPSTITSMQIYFGNRANGLAPGAPITLVVATNPSGSAAFSAASAGVLNVYTSTVGALGGFNSYTLPVTATITSGDFVVGFAVPNPAGLFPADEDQTTPSQGRSYVSSDGLSFSVIDSYGASLAGNFGIRATATLGGSTTGAVIVTSASPPIQPR